MNKTPVLSYVFGLLTLSGFLTLLLTQNSWQSLPDAEFPFYAKAAIVSLAVGVLGLIVEIIRAQINKK